VREEEEKNPAWLLGFGCHFLSAATQSSPELVFHLFGTLSHEVKDKSKEANLYQTGP